MTHPYSMTLGTYNVCSFLWSVETGLQDESIRAKIRPFLKDPNVTDEVLMQQMSMATSAEKERDKTLKNNSVSVCSI